MGKAYCVSDLVVGRSGASTVTEIAMFKKFSILIPYPHARGHQKENALVLSGRNLAYLLEEKDLTEDKLIEVIQGIKNSNDRFSQAHLKMFEQIYVADSEKRLAKEIVHLVQ